MLTLGEPVQNPFVALSDSTTDRTVFIGRGDEQGNFDIQNVPAGTYNMAIWDEQLSYIMRTLPVTVAAGQTVEVRDADPNGEVGVGVSRWFGWLDGIVYKDTEQQREVWTPGEPTIANTDMDQRWRDGSIKEATFTDASRALRVPDRRGRRARQVDHQRAGLRPLLRLPRSVDARRAHRRGDAVLRGRSSRRSGQSVRSRPTRAAACCPTSS